MADELPDPARPGRDRREHGGGPARPDDDALAARTEAERAEAGLEDYDPDSVPPATDAPPGTDVTDTDQYREEEAEVKRQVKAGELAPDDLLPRDARRAFPPTR